MKNKLQKAVQQSNEELKPTNRNRNEARKEVWKRSGNRRGFLKGVLIGASFIAISALGHSLLKPGVTVANTI